MSSQDLTVRASNRQLTDGANRLREAVRAAGGNLVVSQRSGVPLSNLTRYLAGHDMKLPVAVTLAEACNVSLDWLATGRGPMRPGDAPAAPAQPDAVFKPFASMDVDRMVKALEAAARIAAAQGNTRPTTRQLVQGAFVIYEDFLEPNADTNDLASLMEKPE